jgi:hypothetical protein
MGDNTSWSQFLFQFHAPKRSHIRPSQPRVVVGTTPLGDISVSVVTMWILQLLLISVRIFPQIVLLIPHQQYVIDDSDRKDIPLFCFQFITK